MLGGSVACREGDVGRAVGIEGARARCVRVRGGRRRLKGDALKGDALKGDDGFKGEAVEDDVPMPMCGHHARWKPELHRAEQHELLRRQAPQGDRRGRGQGGRCTAGRLTRSRCPTRRRSVEAEIGRHEVRLDENAPGRDAVHLPPLNVQQRLEKKATIAREHREDRSVPWRERAESRGRAGEVQGLEGHTGRRVCHDCFAKEEFKAARSRKIQHQKAQVRASTRGSGGDAGQSL